MKKKILSIVVMLSLTITTFLIGLNVGNNNTIAGKQQNSIPVSDIATMEINQDGYYELTIKDINYVNDNNNNLSYNYIMGKVNQ